MTDDVKDPVVALANTIVTAIDAVSKDSLASDRAIFGLIETVVAKVNELDSRIARLEQAVALLTYDPTDRVS